RFRADRFTLIKDTSTLLQDDFSDGFAPPSSPNFTSGTAASYFTNGIFTESGGELFLDSNNATSFVGVGTTDPTIGQIALPSTNIDPSGLTRGLKHNHQFTIQGVFDLIL